MRKVTFTTFVVIAMGSAWLLLESSFKFYREVDSAAANINRLNRFGVVSHCNALYATYVAIRFMHILNGVLKRKKMMVKIYSQF